jgi:hypothetical protein
MPSTLTDHLVRLLQSPPSLSDEGLARFAQVPILAKTALERAAIAVFLLINYRQDCRAYDNCFEMDDGDEVVCHLISYAKLNEAYKTRLAENYRPHLLTDGFPTEWLDLWNRHQNPLQIAA